MSFSQLDAVLLQVLLLGSGLALPVKLLVDYLKQTSRITRRILPWTAISLGIFFCLIVQIALTEPSMQGLTLSLLGGVMTGSLAIGATEMHEWARGRRQQVRSSSGNVDYLNLDLVPILQRERKCAQMENLHEEPESR